MPARRVPADDDAVGVRAVRGAFAREPRHRAPGLVDDRRDRHVGAQVVIDDRDRVAARHERRRDEGKIALVEHPPVAAVEEQERAFRARRRQEEVQRLLRAGAEAQVQLGRQRRPRLRRSLGEMREPARVVRNRGAVVVAALDELRRVFDRAHSLPLIRIDANHAMPGAIARVPLLRFTRHPAASQAPPPRTPAARCRRPRCAAASDSGERSSSTRRALASCGTRQMSASVGASPWQKAPVAVVARELRLQRLEADVAPVPVPAVLLRLGRAERAGQVVQHAQVVERMDVAGDRQRERAHARAARRRPAAAAAAAGASRPATR